MRKALYILILTLLVSCSPSISGLYKFELCGKIPDCSMYDFCKDGRFTYWYSQDILGSATLTGDWTRKGDTISVKADKYIFSAKTRLICKRVDSSHFTTIKIRLLPKYFKNKRDTTFMGWTVKINNEKRLYETNDRGVLKIPYQPVKKVTVQDSFIRLGLKPLVKLKDSIFSIKNNANDIGIYIADNNSEPSIMWSNEKLIIKGRKLISIVPDSVKKPIPDKYIRIKRKCGTLKNE